MRWTRQPKGPMTDVDRVVRAWRRNTLMYGVIAALLVAVLVINVVRLIDQPASRDIAVVCPSGLSHGCVAVRP